MFASIAVNSSDFLGVLSILGPCVISHTVWDIVFRKNKIEAILGLFTLCVFLVRFYFFLSSSYFPLLQSNSNVLTVNSGYTDSPSDKIFVSVLPDYYGTSSLLGFARHATSG